MMPSDASSLTLDRLRPCQAARIIELRGAEAVRHRLRDLGFREGEWVVMVKQAPLADPVEYRVQCTHVSLRRDEAQRILVDALRPAPCFDPRVATTDPDATCAHGPGMRRGWGWGRRERGTGQPPRRGWRFGWKRALRRGGHGRGGRRQAPKRQGH